MHLYSPDPASLSITAEGVVDFVMPLARTEEIAVRDTLWQTVMPAIRAQDDAAHRLLGAVFAKHATDVLGGYRAVALLRRLRDRGIAPQPHPRTPVWSALIEGHRPPEPLILAILRAGYAYEPGWKAAARYARGLLKPALPVVSPRRSVNMAREIVTVSNSPMIRQHAEAIGESVRLVSIHDWFRPLRRSDLPACSSQHDVVLALATQATDACFAAGGETVPEGLARHLRDSLAELLLLADRYYARMIREAKWIPRQFWSGSGGILQQRLLRQAVQAVGGVVTAHDHAHGQGIAEGYHDTVIELPYCNRFMTWTGAQCDVARHHLRPDLLPHAAIPEIAIVPGQFRPVAPAQPVSATSDAGGRQKTAIMVGILYQDERVQHTPAPTTAVLVDWEARMIASLRRLGYRVIFKPHPESPFPPPPAYFDQLGAELRTERFESIFGDADLIVFGFARTTTFYVSCASEVPILVADMGYGEWTDDAWQLLSRRAGVIAGQAGQDNRIEMDWSALPAAIAHAEMAKDKSFVQTFLSGR